MKVIRKSDDETTYVIKLNKREQQVIEYVINNDDKFNRNFDVFDTESIGEYIIVENSTLPVSYCLEYLNYCFANDMIDLAIRREKIKKIQDAI